MWNAGAAIIQNFDQVRAAIEAMDESAGSSDKEMETIEQSLEYRINALKETWVGTIQQMVDRGDLGTIVDSLTKLSEGIGFVIDKLGILGSIGLGAGIFAGIKNVGEWNYISKFHSNNIICFIVWMCRLYSLTYMGKAYKDSVPIMRYIIINKIHTHLYVGRYGLNRLMGNNTMTGNLVPYIIWYI